MEDDSKTVITLSLTVAEVNVALVGLSKLPFESSADIIYKIQSQAKEQLEVEKSTGEGE